MDDSTFEDTSYSARDLTAPWIHVEDTVPPESPLQRLAPVAARAHAVSALDGCRDSAPRTDSIDSRFVSTFTERTIFSSSL